MFSSGGKFHKFHESRAPGSTALRGVQAEGRDTGKTTALVSASHLFVCAPSPFPFEELPSLLTLQTVN